MLINVGWAKRSVPTTLLNNTITFYSELLTIALRDIQRQDTATYEHLRPFH
jgi:hypothetical protein